MKSDEVMQQIQSDKLTLVTTDRLIHLRSAIQTVQQEQIAGDLIETGIWRGGTCIFMRSVLEDVGDTTRCVYACDSFEGNPKPDTASYPMDSYSTHYQSPHLKVPEVECREAFDRYGYLDDRSIFVKGWFRDTLPTLKPKSGKWAILRLDGDLYESTIVALRSLYVDLSPGGFVIVDDWATDVGAQFAVRDFLYEVGVYSGKITPCHQIAGERHPMQLGLSIAGWSCWWRKK